MSSVRFYSFIAISFIIGAQIGAQAEESIDCSNIQDAAQEESCVYSSIQESMEIIDPNLIPKKEDRIKNGYFEVPMFGEHKYFLDGQKYSLWDQKKSIFDKNFVLRYDTRNPRSFLVRGFHIYAPGMIRGQFDADETMYAPFVIDIRYHDGIDGTLHVQGILKITRTGDEIAITVFRFTDSSDGEALRREVFKKIKGASGVSYDFDAAKMIVDAELIHFFSKTPGAKDNLYEAIATQFATIKGVKQP